MRAKSGTSLEAKLCLLTIGLLFTVLLGVGHFAMDQQRSALMEQQQTTFNALGRAIALASQPIAETGNAAMGNRIARQLKQSGVDVEYIVVTDAKGEAIVAHTKGGSSTADESLPQQTARLARYLIGGGGYDDGVYRVVVPADLVDGAGKVAIGLSLAQANATIDDLQTRILGVFAVACIVGLAGALALGRGISSQLRSLTNAAKAVAGGDLDRSVEETSTDEIGQLASSFNVMVKSLRESQERLIERANTDSLTGLYNHRYFHERLAAELSRAQRYKHDLAVLMIDLDKFKNFNDRHGHPCGDQALRDIAHIMRTVVRDMDVVARYGGEEFAVILPETNLADAYAAAERLRMAVTRHCFYGKDEETVPMTISVGVAQYPLHSAEREGLIMAADMALYRAKSTGRNKTCRFDLEVQDNPAGDPYKVYVLLRATDIGTVGALADAIDSKHRFPIGHTKEVAEQAFSLAQSLQMSDEDCESARIASLLRDIGQLALPDDLLNKPEPLSSEDREALASHPSLGHSIVQKAPRLKSMLPGILHHHEAYDGTGYPFAMKGEEIPLVARVIAVVDSYFAMVTDRPHRAKLDPAAAKQELVRMSGKQFDPTVVEAFLKQLAAQDSAKLAA